MNEVIEFHDSDVVAVTLATDTVVVRLAASVHRSEGRPGIDYDTCWLRPVEMRFADGAVEEHLAALPCTLDDGSVFAETEFSGIIPLPLSIRSKVRFVACGLYGERFSVRSTGLELLTLGEGLFIEIFPGTSQS